MSNLIIILAFVAVALFAATIGVIAGYSAGRKNRDIPMVPPAPQAPTTVPQTPTTVATGSYEDRGRIEREEKNEIYRRRMLDEFPELLAQEELIHVD